jgi:hypothetical protein
MIVVSKTSEQRVAMLLERARRAGKTIGFVERNKITGEMEAIRCKKTGAIIRQLQADLSRSTSVVEVGRTTIRHPMIFVTMPDYQEITILSEDGNRHVTSISSSIRGSLTQEDLEEFIAIDLLSMVEEAKLHRHPFSDSLYEHLANFQVKGIE